MTYLKTTLISAAALCVAMPAFAGEGYSTDKKKIETEAATTMTMNTDVMNAEARMDPSKVNDTVGEVLQADGQPSIQSDDEIIVAGEDTIEDDAFRAEDDDGRIADNAIVVPGSADTITTVSCPAGTEAQVDMTCLITGDYEANLDG